MFFAATQQEVRNKTNFSQFLHRVLGWLGFNFTGCLDVGNVGQMTEHDIGAARLRDGIDAPLP